MKTVMRNMKRKLLKISSVKWGRVLLGAVVLAGGGGLPQAGAAVSVDVMGDVAPETVYSGLDGSARDLTKLLSGYVDAVTHVSSPITRSGGGMLVVGDISRGEDPLGSDQLLYQRFLVTGEDAQLKLQYLGGVGAYRNQVGIYTYSASGGGAGNPQAATIQKTLLYTQGVDGVGSEAVFTVPAGSYFGFYIDANGGVSSKGIYYSENFRNSDNVAGVGSQAGVETDHFLMFNSNRGLLLAMEDIGWNKKTGKLGDQDYNDGLAVLKYADGTPWVPLVPAAVPEPGSAVLMVLGGMLMWKRKRE